MEKATDWDAYYERPAAMASITRRISAAKILRTLGRRLYVDDLTVCELGGANSSFIGDFLRLNNLAKYDVIDLNDYGIDLLKKRTSDPRVSATVADALALDPKERVYDIVYSVGLIEHFDTARTRQCIDAHFKLCRPGGTVLITFPTPTLPYRLIRGIAEMLAIWTFPDERPLYFDEVLSACAPKGQVVHESINWVIGLTQGYVMAVSAQDEGKVAGAS